MVVKTLLVEPNMSQLRLILPVFSSFLSYMLVNMGLSSIGVFYKQLILTFNENQARTAWVPSLQMASGAILGVIIAPRVRTYGCCVMNFIGSILGCLGYFLASFSKSLIQLYLTFGLLVGISNGFLFYSAAVNIQVTYCKRRSLTTALATCGVSAAVFIFPPLARLLTDRYGWRGCVMILGSIYLQGAVAAQFMAKADVTCPEKKLKENDRKENNSLSLDSIQNVKESQEEETTTQEVRINLEACIKIESIQSIDTINEDSSKLKPNDKVLPLQNNENTNDHDSINSIFIKKSYSYSRPKNYCYKQFRWIFNQLVTFIKESLNFHLLKNYKFVLVLIGSCLTIFGYFVPVLFLPVRSSFALGFSDATIASHLSYLGISVTVGRLVSGSLGDTLFLSYRTAHYAVPILIVGAMNIIAATSLSTVRLMTAYSILYGFFTGFYFVAQQPLLVELLGVQKFAQSFGLFTLFTGTTTLVCQPFAGFLVDSCKNYDLPFIVSGVLQTIGALLILSTSLSKHEDDSKRNCAKICP